MRACMSSATIFYSLVCFSAFAQLAVGQEDFESGGIFSVRVSEVKLDKAIDSDVPSAKIVKMLTDKNSSGIYKRQSVRLSAIERRAAVAQFGQRVPVVVGKAVSGRGATTRQTQLFEVGTILKVTGEFVGNHCFLDVSYESSRLGATNDKEGTPPIETVSVDGTYKVEFGKPMILSSVSNNDSLLLVVTVERL